MHNIAYFSGKVYPDRNFSIGLVPQRKKSSTESRYEHDLRQQGDVDAFALADWLTGATSIGGPTCGVGDSPLLVKSPKSSQKKSVVYGSHGITRFGRRVVKNTCILLQEKFGKSRLGFATATLPDMDYETLRIINGNISDITRRFYQKLKRHCQAIGEEFLYVGCIEIQEKRFAKTSMPVPHLHFVYKSKTSVKSPYLFSTRVAYTHWNNAVNEVLALHGCNPIMGTNGHIGSVKLEPIRKSASAYIGKYLSKGCTVVKAMQDAGFKEFPKQWWTASMQCKKMFKASVIRMDARTCSSLFYDLETWLHEGYIAWCKYVEILIDGRYVTIGLVGRFTKEAYEFFKT